MMSAICGSLHYVAPELLQELPYDGPRADIWSLGIVVYAMALNRLPWGAADRAGVPRSRAP
jgi:serine/threonine protein kinase